MPNIICEDCGNDLSYDPDLEEDLHLPPGEAGCSCGDDELPSHDYEPPLNFLGEGDVYYGIELEIDGGRRGSCITDLRELDPRERHFWLKEDGSLSDSGIEIATQPATLGYHRSEFPWRKITRAAGSNGYSSHDTDTCGLHVHMNREALGRYEDLTLSKLILFMWRHWNRILQLSRRNNLRWSAPNHEGWNREHVRDHRPLGKPERCGICINSAKRRGKYVALNMDHGYTLELRVFRGTLRVESIYAAIEFLDTMVTYCRPRKPLNVATSTWPSFLKTAHKLEARNFLDYSAGRISRFADGGEV